MGRSGAFTVGPTVKACTKGIWLWGKAMELDGTDTHATILFAGELHQARASLALFQLAVAELALTVDEMIRADAPVTYEEAVAP